MENRKFATEIIYKSNSTTPSKNKSKLVGKKTKTFLTSQNYLPPK